MVERKVGTKVIRLVDGDITDMEADAFVFDIDDDCRLGSGYGTAISGRAGKVVQDELDAIGQCPKGEAVVTSAGKLKVQYIIHANGPKFHEPETEKKLASATKASLQRAVENGVKKLLLPPMGTGVYQVPLDLCARVMINAVAEHLRGETTLEEVDFVALNTRERVPFEAELQKGA